MLIWLCRNVEDKERQERKKEETKKKFIKCSWYNFAEGNEHIIFVNFEKALVKIIIIKTIFKKPTHRLSYHLILHSDMLSWIWQIRTELQELCVTHILQGSGVSTRLLCGYRLWWKEDGEPQCYEQQNHRHVLIRGIIAKAVLYWGMASFCFVLFCFFCPSWFPAFCLLLLTQCQGPSGVTSVSPL